MLGENAFGHFRDLLAAVTPHPMMGIWLSHLRIQKEDLVNVEEHPQRTRKRLA